MTPHYAVKSNNDRRLLQWLSEDGVRFDCASPQEIRQALNTGSPANHIIYANPCKSTDDIRAAQQLGVSTTVTDSAEEVQKLLEAGWSGNTLIRLKVPDAASAQPFSRKFGAPLAWVPDILDMLRGSKIKHVGWSFHVGSMCGQPSQFREAIELCAEADAIAKTSASIVDIGGGFIASSSGDEFAEAAYEIRTAQRLFSGNTQWIAEPGRFFSSPVVTLKVEVIGVKPRYSSQPFESTEPRWIYTLADSVYGSFSNIPFDGQKPTYRLLSDEKRPRVRAMLFGRTCDSADCLAENIELPELRVGDVLEVENMGAYTTVSASFFNGFPMPQRRYTRD